MVAPKLPQVDQGESEDATEYSTIFLPMTIGAVRIMKNHEDYMMRLITLDP